MPTVDRTGAPGQDTAARARGSSRRAGQAGHTAAPGEPRQIEPYPRHGSDAWERDAAAPVVCVIDDEAALREALGTLLESAGYETALYSCPAEFLAAARAEECRCLILDVRLRAESGLDFQDWLLGRGIGVPVILVTGYGDIPMTVRAMKQGAVDFLSKPFRPEDMLSAVAAAIRIDARRRQEIALAADVAARYQALSAREKEVIGLVVAGMMNKQVAGELGLSEVTVKIHRSSAMRKMQATSLPDLVRMYQLVDPGNAETSGG